MTRAYRAADGLSNSAGSGIQALFERAIRNPRAIRVVMVEIGAVGPAGVARRERLVAAYEQLLRESIGVPAGSGTIPNPVLRAIAGGLNNILYTYVQSGKHDELSATIAVTHRRHLPQDATQAHLHGVPQAITSSLR